MADGQQILPALQAGGFDGLVRELAKALDIALRQRQEGRALGGKEVVDGSGRHPRRLGDLIQPDVLGIVRLEQGLGRVQQRLVADHAARPRGAAGMSARGLARSLGHRGPQ